MHLKVWSTDTRSEIKSYFILYLSLFFLNKEIYIYKKKKIPNSAHLFFSLLMYLTWTVLHDNKPLGLNDWRSDVTAGHLLVVSSREALAPFLKNEEARLMAENGAKRTPFHYILCAATSPAVKLQEEAVTYLNQGTYTVSLHDDCTDRSSFCHTQSQPKHGRCSEFNPFL